jgi:hypothetical protein
MIRPDGSNPRTLAMFFEENKYLTTSELACLAGVNMETIRLWRKKCGLKSTGNGWGSKRDKIPFTAPKRQRQTFEVTPRDVWDNYEWLNTKYAIEGKGIRLISRMTNANFKLIWQRLRRYGIQIRSHELATSSRNPCCNRKWLLDHYEIEGLSLPRCASLAGVSTYTIYSWLVKFNIYIRDKYERVA